MKKFLEHLYWTGLAFGVIGLVTVFVGLIFLDRPGITLGLYLVVVGILAVIIKKEVCGG